MIAPAIAAPSEPIGLSPLQLFRQTIYTDSDHSRRPRVRPAPARRLGLGSLRCRCFLELGELGPCHGELVAEILEGFPILRRKVPVGVQLFDPGL